MRPGPNPLFSGRMWGKRHSLLEALCQTWNVRLQPAAEHLPISAPARWEEKTRRPFCIGILPQTRSSEAWATRRNVSTHKALFARMGRGWVLRQCPVSRNLRGISSVRWCREWGGGTLLSAGWIWLGRSLLAGWWGDLMLGRHWSHRRSLSWMGWVRTRRNWAVVCWSRSRIITTGRRDGIGARPSMHRRRLWAWNRGVVWRSNVHGMHW